MHKYKQLPTTCLSGTLFENNVGEILNMAANSLQEGISLTRKKLQSVNIFEKLSSTAHLTVGELNLLGKMTRPLGLLIGISYQGALLIMKTLCEESVWVGVGGGVRGWG